MPLLRPPASPGLRLFVTTMTGRSGSGRDQGQVGLGLVEHDHHAHDAGVVLRQDRVDRLPQQLGPVPGGDDDVDLGVAVGGPGRGGGRRASRRRGEPAACSVSSVTTRPRCSGSGRAAAGSAR